MWTVEKTRCPVSAAASAMRIVSGSRISPTTMTSGAWRMAARSAVGKSGASTPISICSTRLERCGCSYSTGSSIVTMCRASRRLISSTSAASVVVLPEPVGPPTRTRPRGRRVSASVPGGRPSVARRGGCVGRARTVAAARPRSRCRLIRKRPTPRTRCDPSAIPALRYWARAWDASAGMTASSISSPASGGPESATMLPSMRTAGAAPATSSRSLPARWTSSSSQRSRRTASVGSPAIAAEPGRSSFNSRISWLMSSVSSIGSSAEGVRSLGRGRLS